MHTGLVCVGSEPWDLEQRLLGAECQTWVCAWVCARVCAWPPSTQGPAVRAPPQPTQRDWMNRGRMGSARGHAARADAKPKPLHLHAVCPPRRQVRADHGWPAGQPRG